MISEAAMTVLREIPKEFLSAGYTAYGGVIRDAAGQIVAHLALPASELGMPVLSTIMSGPVAIASSAIGTVSSLVANAQLVSLSREVHKVLNVAMTGTALAGLGLATSMVGFWYLGRRLNHVEENVSELKIGVNKLKKILETAQKAKLQSAIDSYRLACNNKKIRQREQLLLGARKDFATLAFFYKDMAKGLSDLAEVELAEGFFVVAGLGDAVCTSDLGMYQDAADTLRSHVTDWNSIARRQCKELLDLENPARLLEGQYVKDLPTRTLTRVLDFANGESRGLEWMDVLRGPIGTIRWPQFSTVDAEKIAFAKSLCERNEVLSSYVQHFDGLARLEVPATEYARQLMEKTKDGHVVLNRVPTTPLTARAPSQKRTQEAKGSA